MTIKKIGVIGAGQMGSGIAHVCALSGYDVGLYDISTDKIEEGLATINGNMARQVKSERITEADRKAALAVQRYRLAADTLPDKLADLVPAYLEAVPKDPFDGNDLRYKKLEPGFVVYSVGEDLSDDGGKERLPDSTVRGGDGGIAQTET